ncbi:MAG: tetratricopeptide repeat protein [Flavobacteriaceae bacterium]|nr:tetratricopeptide repeat protein [Flavobacteriaceae bacterium]
MKKIIYILTLLISTFTIAQNNELFAKGNSLYNDGKYQDAINIYERILDTKNHSAELYFNLANAYYKLNRIAPSVYYYEKALQLSPNDKDIKNNLAFAKNMTIDAIEVIPEMGFSKITNSIINKFSFDVWAMLSVAFVVLFAILFLTYYFSYTTNKKRLAFLSSNLSLLLVLITLVFAFQKYDFDKKNKPAIIFAHESEIKSEPNLRSEIAFKLHEGTKVQVIEIYNENWTKIKLTDGKTGWIPSQDIKEL